MARRRSSVMRVFVCSALGLSACSFPEIAFEAGGGSQTTGGQGSGAASAGGAGSSSDGGAPSSDGGGGGTTTTTISSMSSMTSDGGGGDESSSGGGAPGPVCEDEDEDGFLSEGSSDECDDLPSFQGKKRDCDDDDSLAYPGQELFFVRERHSGGWDFDCNEEVETYYEAACPNPCKAWLPVTPGEGGCGDTTTLKTCNFLLGCLTAGTGAEATQSCR